MPYEDTLPRPSPEIKATYRLLARLRTLAYQGVPSVELAPLLDDAQSMLGVLMLPTADEAEQSHEFCEYLQAIEARHTGFEGIREQYDADIAPLARAPR